MAWPMGRCRFDVDALIEDGRKVNAAEQGEQAMAEARRVSLTLGAYVESLEEPTRSAVAVALVKAIEASQRPPVRATVPRRRPVVTVGRVA